jgi:hypothetical protein
MTIGDTLHRAGAHVADKCRQGTEHVRQGVHSLRDGALEIGEQFRNLPRDVAAQMREDKAWARARYAGLKAGGHSSLVSAGTVAAEYSLDTLMSASVAGMGGPFAALTVQTAKGVLLPHGPRAISR